MLKARNGKPISVTFQFLGDEEDQVLAAYPRERVHALKAQLCQRLGIQASRLQCIFGVDVLKAAQTVQQCKLEEGSVVNVIVLPPLYEGSQYYNWLATQLAWRENHEEVDREQITQSMQIVMTSKMALHDALAQKGLLR